MDAGMQFRVKAHALNLRSQPRKTEGSRIALLPQGQRVVFLEETRDDKWWKVSAEFAGANPTGFVAHEFLEAANVTGGSVPAVHLTNPGLSVTRKNKAWAYALTEPDAPRRTSAGQGASQQLLDIVEWLDVQRATHLRYQPAADTYCNIYGYDYCFLSGAYLPRVWWNSHAIHDWRNGKPVPIKYAATVGELNANALFDWLAEWGDDFGWSREVSKTAVQDAANSGKVVVMSGVRTNRNQAGHITAVVPEHGNKKAVRNAQNEVQVPLQSQAGRTNKKYHTDDWGTGNQNWSDRGFWIHE